MEVVLDLNQRYTYADYLTWWDDKRRELVGGLVKMMSPAASVSHARVVVNIINLMVNYIRKHKGKCEVFTAPFDVRLPKNGEKENHLIQTVVQPDIVVVCNPEKIDEKGCLGAPDLIVEILSPSTRRYDLNDKYNLYEAFGVKEYWVIAPKDKDVTVFLLQENGRYNEGIIYADPAIIPVQTLSGLEIDSKDLFR
jgi:Uma2 family endonuclease